jgi:formyl-CoA transferase/CoA:oxalate CoA-transferase
MERGFVVELEHPLAGLVKSLANPVRFSDTPVSYRLPPPTLGEHNMAILEGLEYTAQEISQFAEQGIMGQHRLVG